MSWQQFLVFANHHECQSNTILNHENWTDATLKPLSLNPVLWHCITVKTPQKMLEVRATVYGSTPPAGHWGKQRIWDLDTHCRTVLYCMLTFLFGVLFLLFIWSFTCQRNEKNCKCHFLNWVMIILIHGFYL